MTETTINVALLRDTLKDITAHPERWNQSNWAKHLYEVDGKKLDALRSSELWWETDADEVDKLTVCGTACCLAGNVVSTQLGGKLVFEWGDQSSREVILDGEQQPIADAAQKHLGLTGDQARMLFSGGNTLAILWDYANRFTNGEIEIPEQFRL